MILSLIVLIFFLSAPSAQDLIIKQPPIEPVKTSSQIVQPRVEPPPPQPIAPLAKEPMIVSVQPDQAVQPVRPPTPPPRDFIQADRLAPRHAIHHYREQLFQGLLSRRSRKASSRLLKRSISFNQAIRLRPDSNLLRISRSGLRPSLLRRGSC